MSEKQRPETLIEVLQQSEKRFGDAPAFKVREHERGPLKPISYQELYRRIEAFGTGIHSMGIEPQDHVAIVSDNRLEWIVSDLGIIGNRAVDVPLSGNTARAELSFKLMHADTVAAILEGTRQFQEFYSEDGGIPGIKTIIMIEPVEVFGERENLPDWAHPESYRIENQTIAPELHSQLQSLARGERKQVILSRDAAEFVKEVSLSRDGSSTLENLFRGTGYHGNSLGTAVEKLLEKALIIDDAFCARHHILLFDEVMEHGRKLISQGDCSFADTASGAQPDDLVAIIYTSGTTGNPKGVMLSNSNIIHNINEVVPLFDISHTDRFVSVLPTWHILERTVEYCALSAGSSTAYSKPARQVLLRDLREEKPTIMVSVPRIWESVYKSVMDTIVSEQPAKKAIATAAFALGRTYRRAQRIREGSFPCFREGSEGTLNRTIASATAAILAVPSVLAKKVVFRKIKEMTGGSLRFVVSGGAALPNNIDEFFDSIGIRIYEGYGLTETSPIVAVRTPHENIIFTVGPCVPETQVRIIDRERFDESGGIEDVANGTAGIVFIAGPQVMQGYYKNEKETQNALRDIAGTTWFNSGDLGRKTIDGSYLEIRGRVKDTIVLRGGEKAEPLPLEEKLSESPYISQVVVVGQDYHRLGALVVPDQKAVVDYAKQQGIPSENISELMGHEGIKALFAAERNRLLAGRDGFKPHETALAITLMPDAFTIDGGEMTETLKYKRGAIHQKYASQIAQLCGKHA